MNEPPKKARHASNVNLLDAIKLCVCEIKINPRINFNWYAYMWRSYNSQRVTSKVPFFLFQNRLPFDLSSFDLKP